MFDQVIVGRYSSGEFARLPDGSDQSVFEASFKTLSTSQQVELLCILESFLLDVERGKIAQNRSLILAHIVLLEFTKTEILQHEMLRRGILTSIDRVRIGNKLRL